MATSSATGCVRVLQSFGSTMSLRAVMIIYFYHFVRGTSFQLVTAAIQSPHRPESELLDYSNQVEIDDSEHGLFSGFSQLQLALGKSSLQPSNFADERTKISTFNVHLGQANLAVKSKSALGSKSFADNQNNVVNPLDPQQPAATFTVQTLDGVVTYPSEILKNDTPIILHTFDNRSAMIECMWNSQSSLQALINTSPNNTHYIFMSTSENAESDANWMKNQIDNTIVAMATEAKVDRLSQLQDLKSRLHYVTMPTYHLGNWLPSVFKYYACQDHGCGYDQIKFDITESKATPVVMKRLDARYDWLPSPVSVFGEKPTQIVSAGNGCQSREDTKGKIAFISNDGECSYFSRVSNMQKSGALGVIVYANPGGYVQDMNCHGDECRNILQIPATMIPYAAAILYQLTIGKVTATFQTTPSDNFYFGIDGKGKLAEIGWLLYPSFEFLGWQAQWFNFKTELYHNLSKEALVIDIFNYTIMQGEGVLATAKLPQYDEMMKYSQVELDMALSCPGTHDATCPPWDHTVQLYVCCDQSSPLCGMELGRWITPFRRRIGRWLTNVTPLLPIFNSNSCNFTMKTVPWAKPWKPALKLRLSGHLGKQDIYSKGDKAPFQIIPLFRGGTFNKTYNTKYSPIAFTLSDDTTKVEIVAVITGHGSDENGCGEFCPTSHHFVVNGNVTNNKTFDIAGSPLGCADNVPTGVEPNEHGTWLYGRDGWCDGRQVDPWVIDITEQVQKQATNTVTYYGWYNGADPDPKQSAGYIIMYSYLVYYRNI